MDRRTVTQLVAMVVVLCVLMRWLPAGDERGALGLGDPWRTIALDREVARMGGDSDAAVAFLRFRPPPDGPKTLADRQRAQQAADWRAKLKMVRDLRRDAGPDTVIEFQGVPRNEVWPLMFRLYPVPTTSWTLEEGSRFGDEPLPYTAVFPKGLDETRFQKSVDQMKDGLRKRYERMGLGKPTDAALPEWARPEYAARVRGELFERAQQYEPPRTAQRDRGGAEADGP